MHSNRNNNKLLNSLKPLVVNQQEWDQFKEKNKLQDSLKGGTGLLAKRDFLERTDHRRFEIERDARNAERAKRDAEGK